jgi:hypothetical protein
METFAYGCHNFVHRNGFTASRTGYGHVRSRYVIAATKFASNGKVSLQFGSTFSTIKAGSMIEFPIH